MDEGTRASGRGESPAVLLTRGAQARRGMWEHPHGMRQRRGLSASADTSLWLPCQSLLLMGWASQERAEGPAVAALTPVGLSLDPDPAGAAGEQTQHAAGSPAAGELHPEGCPLPDQQLDGEQVRLGRGAEPGAALWQALGVAVHQAWPPAFWRVLLQAPQLAGGRGGSEEEIAKWLLGAWQGKRGCFSQVEGQGKPSLLWGHLC